MGTVSQLNEDIVQRWATMSEDAHAFALSGNMRSMMAGYLERYLRKVKTGQIFKDSMRLLWISMVVRWLEVRRDGTKKGS